MDWEAILKQKATRICKRRLYLYLALLVLALLIGSLIVLADQWRSCGTAWRYNLLLAAAMVISAFIWLGLGLKIRPESFRTDAQRIQTRHKAFLLTWSVIIFGTMLLTGFFRYVILPLFLLIVYACCYQSICVYVRAARQPQLPKSILLALPTENIESLMVLSRFTGIFVSFLVLVVVVVAVSLIPSSPSKEVAVLVLVLCLMLVTAFLFILIGFGVRFQANPSGWQRFCRALLYSAYADVRRQPLPLTVNQIKLFDWCLSHPGNPNPPLQLLAPFSPEPPQKALFKDLRIGSLAGYVPQSHELPQATEITPLLRAVMDGNLSALQELLPSRELNQAFAVNGNTPLHIAVWNGHAELIRLLLAQPYIDKSAKNHAGKTPLDLAREKNCTEIIRLLS